MTRDIFYAVADSPVVAVMGGSGTTVHLTTEAEWDTLLDRFCDYAAAGEQVVYCSARATGKGHGQPSIAKDTPTTITTANRDELKTWMKEMERAGKSVRVTYNEGNGTWSGMAYANLRPQDDQTAARAYSGVIAFVPTPAVDNPPTGGRVMALQVSDDTTYMITVYGMLMWIDADAPDEALAALEGSQATFTGVAAEHDDTNGGTFLSLDLEVPDDGIIEF